MAILRTVAMQSFTGTSRTATFSGAVTPGSRIVVLATQENPAGTFAVSDPTNGSYTQDALGTSTGGGGTGAGRSAIHSVLNTASSAITVTLTFGASAAGTLTVYEISGVGAVDVANGFGGSSSLNTGTVTTTQAGDAVFAVGAHYPNGATVDGGYTQAFAETGISNAYHYGEYNLSAGAAGAKTLTFGLGSSEDRWSLAIVAYAPQSSNTGTVSADLINLQRRNRPGRGPYSLGRYFRPFGETALPPAPTLINGAASIALGNMTVSSAATLALAGSSSSTLGPTTLSSAATLAIAGALAKQLGDVTLSGVGTVALSGSVAVALGDTMVSSAATLALAAALAVALDGVSISSAAVVAIAGTLAKALGDTTSSSAGTLALSAALAAQLGDITLSAAGGFSDIAGTATITLGDTTLSSAAALALAAAAGIALGNVTLSAAAAVAIAAILGSTLDDVVVEAEGVGLVTSTGSAAVTLGDMTLSSATTLALAGALSSQLGNLTISAAAALALAGDVDITLGDVTLHSTSTMSGGGSADPADVWNYVLEGGFSAGDILRLMAAVLAGKSTILNLGGGHAHIEFRAIDDSAVRVAAEMTGSERTSLTLTP